ncbi:MAG: OprD family outer membrane porin [Gammaproteobacteria bacterium]
MLAAVLPARASDVADALLRDNEFSLQLRSHYLARDRSAAPDSLGWAAGGWVVYRSGWMGDRLRLGLTGYTSHKLLGPDDKDGAAVLAPGQKDYTVLGEAFGALKLGEATLTAGRFLINQFEVNPQDTRMSPRTFRGAALTGRVSGYDYFAGYIDKMKVRNSEDFVDVAVSAGAPAGVREPMLLLSLRGSPDESLRIGASVYHVHNVLASGYADVTWTLPSDGPTTIRLGAQYMRQGSVGDHVLTGSDFGTWIVGFKGDLVHGPVTLSAIAMQTARDAAYRTPYGSWQGYTSRIINNFHRAGEQVWAADAVADFATLGAPGLGLIASATFGREAINAATGTALPDHTEYNLSVDYRFTSSAWPQSLRPLWLRVRWARLEQSLGGQTDTVTERHAILNYTLRFK